MINISFRCVKRKLNFLYTLLLSEDWYVYSVERKAIRSKEIDPSNLPEHIAIIMDGNGRWAKKRGLPRIAGHREGMKTIQRWLNVPLN